MTELEFDCKKMPLGRLSKQQIKNGYEVLKEIDEEMKNGANSKTLSDLSSRFYTLIPHVFGMKGLCFLRVSCCRTTSSESKRFGFSVPPVIKTVDELKKKMQMLEALTDIEVAATMLKTTGGGKNHKTKHTDSRNSTLKRNKVRKSTPTTRSSTATSSRSTSRPKSTSASKNTFATRKCPRMQTTREQ